MLKIVEKGILRFLVASKQKSNAYQESLLENFFFIYILNMLAQEFNAANIN